MFAVRFTTIFWILFTLGHVLFLSNKITISLTSPLSAGLQDEKEAIEKAEVVKHVCDYHFDQECM